MSSMNTTTGRSSFLSSRSMSERKSSNGFSQKVPQSVRAVAIVAKSFATNDKEKSKQRITASPNNNHKGRLNTIERIQSATPIVKSDRKVAATERNGAESTPPTLMIEA